MTDDRVPDLRRELHKARETLAACELHLARHAEMNAALHCATTVMYSPLHARVTAAITQIERALLRTDTDPDTARTVPDTATSDTDTHPVNSALTSADTARTRPDTKPCCGSTVGHYPGCYTRGPAELRDLATELEQAMATGVVSSARLRERVNRIRAALDAAGE
ncbi:hypothetical protein [Streptomyces mobaraensis]|uniref:Uncharacterized protein n=1 Tax=Streptomyces mobaraensis TaxID=35621 RepID=A0A5N5WD13_STRMB|nr:hypothetical protein [Streptomyces mobaraensis]KAB7850163.1 hypothetical protein FRZ00_06080 [Streptomyces mobaraensis]